MTATAPNPTTTPVGRPWAAVWSMVIGFFMILVDSTIVSIANPTIQRDLQTDEAGVIWVTSAYLLAYAVPLLIAGRLGDRFGPRTLYLIGLAIFTASSLWCGLSDSLGMLIAARAVQGFGAALMTPQTMAVITRVFPPARRGPAMALWGATSGVALLVGPLLGGVLVDALGWEWIFFINVPVGILGFVLAAIYVPKLDTHSHSFDVFGVVLSAIGMFLLVFGLQESNSDWFADWWIVSVVAGVVVLAGFLAWQRVNRGEPLLPLRLYADRDFSVGNTVITIIGFSITAMTLPMAYYTQAARGLSPTESALLLVPLAVTTLLLSPIVGRVSGRIDPRLLTVPGLALFAISLFLYSWMAAAQVDIPWLLVPMTIMGVGQAGIWAPIGIATVRNLSPRDAGAGSGVYNSMRQVGGVVGAAVMAAVISAAIAAQFPGVDTSQFEPGGEIPQPVVDGLSTAFSQSLLVPAVVVLVAAGVAALFTKPKPGAPVPSSH
jgi:EmrB/QacA subfamily drug resistance transporter